MEFKIKRGAILLDKKSYHRYLIIDIQDDHIDCLDQYFDRIAIGNNFLSDFEVVETIDMDKFSKWICGTEISDGTYVYEAIK